MKCPACHYEYVKDSVVVKEDRIATRGPRKGKVIGKVERVVKPATAPFLKLKCVGKLEFTMKGRESWDSEREVEVDVVVCPQCGTLKVDHYTIGQG